MKTIIVILAALAAGAAHCAEEFAPPADSIRDETGYHALGGAE